MQTHIRPLGLLVLFLLIGSNVISSTSVIAALRNINAARDSSALHERYGSPVMKQDTTKAIQLTGAQLSVSPQSAVAAPAVKITGAGFGKRAKGSITFDNATIARFTTDSTGNFSLNWSIPADTSAGTHELRASTTSTSATTSLYIEVPAAPRYQFIRLSNPERTIVSDATGIWLATFTDGAYTVTLAGPSRTFSESTAAYPVMTTSWVRVLPAPFNGQVDEAWLTQALADTSPDVLQLAMQYIENASSIYDPTGVKIAGDADYGPLQADGTRQEGSDFNDYLGIAWNYTSTVDGPEPEQINSLDCSGFVRMVLGYRSGLPLTLKPDGSSIPRRSFQMLDSAPGLVTITNTGTQVTEFSRLSAGDLVFFDASTDDGDQIDHVGLYLGQDTDGHYRFISSRKKVNGPTLGDYGGKSLLDGTGLYAKSFRAARRL